MHPSIALSLVATAFVICAFSSFRSHTTRFLFVGFVKRLVYVLPIPRDVDELKARITEAIATIDNAMLGRVWQELDYWLDVCRVTNGAHIEHL